MLEIWRPTTHQKPRDLLLSYLIKIPSHCLAYRVKRCPRVYVCPHSKLFEAGCGIRSATIPVERQGYRLRKVPIDVTAGFLGQQQMDVSIVSPETQESDRVPRRGHCGGGPGLPVRLVIIKVYM